MAQKTTPQRLREIIDLLGKATTFAQQKTVRDSLTHDELMDYEAYTQGLPGAVQPAIKGQVSPERLKEIINLIARATTFAEQKTARDSLTYDELMDYEAYTQGLPGAVQPATTLKTTPQRLREIIDLLGKATTFAEQKTARDSLTYDELMDYEAYTQDLPGAVQPAPEAPIPPVPAPPQKLPEIKPTLIIARTPYPKWWKDQGTTAINLSDAGTQTLVPGRSDVAVFIGSIILTVSGETNISFTFGVFGETGSMDFGGENEPRGMAAAFGNSPAPCGPGGFSITSTGAGIHVGGLVTYFRESVKETP